MSAAHSIPQSSAAIDADRASPAGSGSVVQCFERLVDVNPCGVAVRRIGTAGHRDEIQFGQLDAWANAIASRLQEGIGQLEPVALAIQSPQLMLAAALGALKAGRPYVAVNPAHPKPHRRGVLDELDPSLLLVDELGEVVADGHRLALSVEELVAGSGMSDRLDIQIDEAAIAYVLYTSGSTGRPRGIAQSRRDMWHNFLRHEPLGVSDADCITLISADGFVASISNPYLALLSGATLAPYSFRESGAEGMLDWLASSGVTVLYGFPSFVREIGRYEATTIYRKLRLAYLGGETVLPSDLATTRRLFPEARIAVGLNSSETGLTCLETIPAEQPLPAEVSVGRPVLDIEVSAVDHEGEPLPHGMPGELAIRSRYVRPTDWSGGAIRADDEKGLFRTGDRGRVEANGRVFHLGRVDQVVKVRGHRIELTEVERAIARLPEALEVAVVTGDGGTGEVELTAFVRSRRLDLDPRTVRERVAAEMPSAAIPAHVRIVDTLPRTPNGKLDRGSLRAVVGKSGAWDGDSSIIASAATGEAHGRRSATTDMRELVAVIWQSELRLEAISPDENFFALGGTSIAAVAVIAQLRRATRVQVPLALLFECPTIAELAVAIERFLVKTAPSSVAAIVGPAVRAAREDDIPAICSLVNRFVTDTTINFHTEARAAEEWEERWRTNRARYPWLVAERKGRFVGTAYAGPWKSRGAYDWTAEVAVYVDPDEGRRGVGSALYRELLGHLDNQGYQSEVAAIALPNVASVRLHENFGFTQAGTLIDVGFKHGEWLDIEFWQRRVKVPEKAPVPIRPVAGM